MAYKEWFDHFQFFRILALSIPKGASSMCEDTETRQKWLSQYSHLFTGAMLLNSFSYAEGILGAGWIDAHGKDFEEELTSLQIIRNAITHNDGNIKSNLRRRGHTGPEQFIFVGRFVVKLLSNEYIPLNEWDADKRAEYITLEDSGLVKLGDSSYGRIGAVVNNVFLRAGVISHADSS